MYNRAEEYSRQLETTHMKHEVAKAKSDELLYSMLPRQVADMLRQGNDPYASCKVSRLHVGHLIHLTSLYL